MFTEVYEDNGGGVYLFVLDGDLHPYRVFGDWELGEAGCLKKAIEEFEDDPEVIECWENDTMKVIEEIFENDDNFDAPNIDEVYNQFMLGDIVRDIEGEIVGNPGFAARKALALEVL